MYKCVINIITTTTLLYAQGAKPSYRIISNDKNELVIALGEENITITKNGTWRPTSFRSININKDHILYIINWKSESDSGVKIFKLDHKINKAIELKIPHGDYIGRMGGKYLVFLGDVYDENDQYYDGVVVVNGISKKHKFVASNIPPNSVKWHANKIVINWTNPITRKEETYSEIIDF